jgi:hypothetical protein
LPSAKIRPDQASAHHPSSQPNLSLQPSVRYFAAMVIILARTRLPIGSSFFREPGPHWPITPREARVRTG